MPRWVRARGAPVVLAASDRVVPAVAESVAEADSTWEVLGAAVPAVLVAEVLEAEVLVAEILVGQSRMSENRGGREAEVPVGHADLVVPWPAAVDSPLIRWLV